MSAIISFNNTTDLLANALTATTAAIGIQNTPALSQNAIQFKVYKNCTIARSVVAGFTTSIIDSNANVVTGILIPGTYWLRVIPTAVVTTLVNATVLTVTSANIYTDYFNTIYFNTPVGVTGNVSSTGIITLTFNNVLYDSEADYGVSTTFKQDLDFVVSSSPSVFSNFNLNILQDDKLSLYTIGGTSQVYNGIITYTPSIVDAVVNLIVA